MQGAKYERTILQLNRNRLVRAFHQKPKDITPPSVRFRGSDEALCLRKLSWCYALERQVGSLPDELHVGNFFLSIILLS
jgi:hypothetical protein